MHRLDLRALTAVLAREVDLLERLLAILQEGQAILVKGNVERIKEIIEKQINLVDQFAAVERERQAVLGNLNRDGRYGNDVQMDLLIEEADGESASTLRSLRTSLREVLGKLGTVNKRNSMLIRQSLSYIDRTIRLIAGEDGSAKQYTASGDLRSIVGNVAVDRKI
jgi:flagellar biosynthesis/type III secretory pathway chaperone